MCKRQHSVFQSIEKPLVMCIQSLLTFVKYSLLYMFILKQSPFYSIFVRNQYLFINIVFLFTLKSGLKPHPTVLSSPRKDTDSFTVLAIKQACLLETFIDEGQLKCVQLSEHMKYNDKFNYSDWSAHSIHRGLKSISGCLSISLLLGTKCCANISQCVSLCGQT